MLSIVMLSIVMLSIIMLSAFTLRTTALKYDLLILGSFSTVDLFVLTSLDQCISILKIFLPLL
jgi:hypothetical protein